MRQGPIDSNGTLVCTGCEFSNRKQVAGANVVVKVVEGEGFLDKYYGTAYQCLHLKAKRHELRADDICPVWCPIINKSNEK